MMTTAMCKTEIKIFGMCSLSETNKKKTMENNGKSREVAVLQSELLKIQWQADLIHLGLGKPWKKEAEEDPQPNNAHNASHSLVASHAHRCHLPPHNIHTRRPLTQFTWWEPGLLSAGSLRAN